MTRTPSDDQPDFVGEEPEYCSACFRPVRRDPNNHLSLEREVSCADSALAGEVVRVREGLVVGVKCNRLLVRWVEAEMAVSIGEIRHLVNALTGPAGGPAGLESQ